ncbi:hypothetical protein RDWZM_007216 [Blomia tropicalis]|uniref:protein-tyrosine-phosphatase n=1 Tax=Blomia tropicalis TaxID=40697 RepID=A0A9Q0M9Q2_BLOTA|nr:hypothetical protein RDWZM_007216 [Blomia tropicalis]
MKSENKELNRYSDVIPCMHAQFTLVITNITLNVYVIENYLDDKTRVKLKRHNLNYINASYVSLPSAKRNYILTQGPLEITCGHFWLMIWEQQSKAIIMLNNLIERGVSKCYQYWPNGEINDDVDQIEFNDVNLTVQFLSHYKFDYYQLRRFKLIDQISNNSREIHHFHYTHWPDFDLPKDPNSFLSYLNAVRDSGSLDLNLHGPPIVHCSAGIGRSGTFVLVDSCLVLIEANKSIDSINVIDILLEMRKCRMGLIQTSAQFRFSFKAIIEGSKHIFEKQRQTKLEGSNNSNSSLMRSFGVNEDDEDVNYVNQDLDQNEEVNEPQTISPNNVTEGSELRQRRREEKRQKTMETIERIKRKQKEVEERLNFNRKLYQYLTPVAIVGGAVAFCCIGLYIYLRE